MTYKEIINRFRTITDNHLMLQDFGYGDLSDLKYVSQLGDEASRVSYPYLYLLPSSSTRNGPVMNYSFNMIVMDMARTENPDRQQGRRLGKGVNQDHGDFVGNYITIQSQCQQYIDDVLARLYYFYKDQPEITLTGITYTPFKEKYQDVVAGMTATITIQVPTPLNECIAPYDNWVLQTELILEENVVLDYNATNGIAVYDIPEGPPQKYRIELDLDFKVLYDISQDPAPYDTPYFSVMQDANDESPRDLKEIFFSGTDRSIQQMRETFELIIGDIPGGSNNRLFFRWGEAPQGDGPWYPNPPISPILEEDAIQQIRGTVKIYKAAP